VKYEVQELSPLFCHAVIYSYFNIVPLELELFVVVRNFLRFRAKTFYSNLKSRDL
jgi:hypothetical protein